MDRRDFLKILGLAAVATLSPGLAAKALASETLVGPIDLNDPKTYKTDVKVGLTPLDVSRRRMWGRIYVPQEYGASTMVTAGRFRFEVEQPAIEGEKEPRRKENGDFSVVLYGHEFENCGKKTKFKRIAGKTSFEMTRENGKISAKRFSPEGEAFEIDPNSAEYQEAEKVVDAVFRRGSRDIEGNKIYLKMPTPDEPCWNGGIRGFIKRVFDPS